MGDFNTEAFTLLAVAIVVIGLRTTARWIMVGPRNFQPDDYLMLLACVSSAIIEQRRILISYGGTDRRSRWCTGWKLALHIWLAHGSWALPIIP